VLNVGYYEVCHADLLTNVVDPLDVVLGGSLQLNGVSSGLDNDLGTLVHGFVDHPVASLDIFELSGARPVLVKYALDLSVVPVVDSTIDHDASSSSSENLFNEWHK